jgi:hypothetical protein
VDIKGREEAAAIGRKAAPRAACRRAARLVELAQQRGRRDEAEERPLVLGRAEPRSVEPGAVRAMIGEEDEERVGGEAWREAAEQRRECVVERAEA